MSFVLCVPLEYNLISMIEHHGHPDSHIFIPIMGTFIVGTPKCTVSHRNVITHGDVSIELCTDFGGELQGHMNALPRKVKVSGRFVATVDSSVIAHSGEAHVLEQGNTKLKIGGV